MEQEEYSQSKIILNTRGNNKIKQAKKTPSNFHFI